MAEPVSLTLSRAVHLVNRFAPEIRTKFVEDGVEIGRYLVALREPEAEEPWSVYELSESINRPKQLEHVRTEDFEQADTAVFYAASEALWHLLGEAMGRESGVGSQDNGSAQVTTMPPADSRPPTSAVHLAGRLRRLCEEGPTYGPTYAFIEAVLAELDRDEDARPSSG
jgi:hypothetical protein